MYKEYVYFGVGSNLENFIKCVIDVFFVLYIIEDMWVLKILLFYSSKFMGL